MDEQRQRELDEVNREVARLRDEEAKLENLRNAKMERIRLKLANFGNRIKADHPIATAVASGVGHSFVNGVKSYINYLGKQDVQRLRQEKKAHKTQNKKKDSDYITIKIDKKALAVA